MSTIPNNRVLIVDDQAAIHEDFREMLAPAPQPSTDALAAAFVDEEPRSFLPKLELLHAHSGQEACAVVEAANAAGSPIALAFVDIRMPPGMDGVTTVQRIRETDPHIEFVLMTAYSDRSLPDIVEDIAPLHKLLYIRKPFTREEVQQMAMALVEKYNAAQALAARERQLAASYGRLEAILAATGEAIAMFDLLGRLAFANRRYEELCDAAPGALDGKPEETCLPRLGPPTPEDMEHAAVFGDEERLREFSGAGVRRLFHCTESDVHGAGGDVIGRLHILRDVSTQIDNRRMDAELRQMRFELASSHSFEGLLGASRSMREVFALVERAAQGDLPVLIRGESGTGKELVAKALHFNGPRKAQGLEVVNCAALPDALVESELFGHERGAFTGAIRRRLGAFERADGGTVFLDEIADMKPDLQAKLLRVLQEREIQRLGGSERIAVDVQIIAATNRDLEQAMRDGTFREDLFYRIAAFPITLPPLRERSDDIPLLAQHFLDRAAESSGRDALQFAPDAVLRMLRHDWPGNVRELESAVGRAALLATSDALHAEDLLPANADEPPTLTGDGLTLAEAERQAVVRALASSSNNITQAARTLAIDRTTLHRKMKRLGLHR